MSFTRRIEDFTCAQCGAANKGDGYTNHCYRCLYSLHVDDDPGDRACACHGLMKPVGAQQLGGRIVILHECMSCGAIKRCKSVDRDLVDSIIAVMRGAADAATHGRGRPRAGRPRERLG